MMSVTSTRTTTTLPRPSAAAAHSASSTEFDAILSAYEKRIYSVVYRLVGNHDDTADVTQETFIRAYRALPRFRGDSDLYTWLYRIAVNCSRNRLKERERLGGAQMESLESLQHDEAMDHLQLPDWTYAPEPLAERHELRDVIYHAIAALPTSYRMPVVLRDIQGLSYHDIGLALSLSTDTVRARLHRGRVILRRKLRTYFTG